MRSHQKRIVWISGASRGIGKALAIEFAQRGDVVIVSSRRKKSLAELHRSIRERGGECIVIPCDVRKNGQVIAARKSIIQRYGQIDILINNAGVTYFELFVHTTLKHFEEVIETNLRGLFLMTQSVLPGMLMKRKGLIVNILSFAAKTVYEQSSVYSASKCGAAALMDVLRRETRQHGIKVVNVYPGAINTPMWSEPIRKRSGSSMGAPEELARMVYEVSIQPENVMIEELVFRPQVGDITI
jgi:short-subunit dehydrogenase